MPSLRWSLRVELLGEKMFMQHAVHIYIPPSGIARMPTVYDGAVSAPFTAEIVEGGLLFDEQLDFKGIFFRVYVATSGKATDNDVTGKYSSTKASS